MIIYKQVTTGIYIQIEREREREREREGGWGVEVGVVGEKQSK